MSDRILVKVSEGVYVEIAATADGALHVTETTLHAGEDLTANVQRVAPKTPTSQQISATTAIIGPRELIGIFVSTVDASGRIAIYDHATADNNLVVAEFTPAASTFYEFKNIPFAIACRIKITAAVSCTAVTVSTVEV